MIRFKRQKGQKYGNTKVKYDNILFDSKKEGEAYLYLKDLQSKGVISDLVLQPKWELVPAIKETYIKQLKTKEKTCVRTVQLAITYKADFAVTYKGQRLVFDVKASPVMLPKEFVLKKKMMRAIHGIDVILIYKLSDFKKYFI